MLVVNDVVNVMAAYKPVCKRAVLQACINDEHNRTIILVLADDGSCVNRNMSEQLSGF